jgi:glutathionylspermidine synthase
MSAARYARRSRAREPRAPRADWQARVESVGCPHHTGADGAPYWDESACYTFSAAEVDVLEEATASCTGSASRRPAHVIERAAWDELAIPAAAVPLIERSWRDDEPTLYGRFDLAYDGPYAAAPLEYNADTPTALVEAAVAQWYWLQDTEPNGDQFNSLHERLVAAWAAMAPGSAARSRRRRRSSTSPRPTTPRTSRPPPTCATPPSRAGWRRRSCSSRRSAGTRRCAASSTSTAAVGAAFKLYPWEWMAREAFAAHLAAAPVRWVEPAWKMVLSNKGILAVLWELFPDHPNLLPGLLRRVAASRRTRASRCSRARGANVRLVMFGEEVAASGGDYGAEGYVYQALAALPALDGRVPVLGSWVVAGEPAGLGVREGDGLITTNLSRFVPHRIG